VGGYIEQSDIDAAKLSPLTVILSITVLVVDFGRLE
jgi:hypothetical protein